MVSGWKTINISSILTCTLVVISNRLVTSSCAIVADAHGYTANIEKMMSKDYFPLSII